MPDDYFAIGTTLANMTNVEATATTAQFHCVPDGLIPLLGPIDRRTLDNAVQRNGAIDVELRCDSMLLSDLDTLILAVWGAYTTASYTGFISWLDITARIGAANYSPFACELGFPTWVSNQGVWAQEVVIPALNCVHQVNTENSTTTITTSERYNESDTTGGAVTLTLPAANAVTANTVYSFVKTGGGNTLTVSRAGADTIDGTTSITVTGRTNIVSDAVSAWTSI